MRGKHKKSNSTLMHVLVKSAIQLWPKHLLMLNHKFVILKWRKNWIKTFFNQKVHHITHRKKDCQILCSSQSGVILKLCFQHVHFRVQQSAYRRALVFLHIFPSPILSDRLLPFHSCTWSRNISEDIKLSWRFFSFEVV